MDNRPKSCNRVTITTSKYRPFIKPELHRPLAPSVTCGDSSLPEGAIGLVPCYIGLCFWGSACCGIPQSKIKDFCQLPLAREPLRPVAAGSAHGGFLRFVTSLTRPPGCPRWQCARWLSANRYFPDPPGIVSLCDTGLFSDFQSTAWEGGGPKTHKPKRGQKLKRSTRAKAKGQSRLVPPGGFLRGEQFERERVVPPLSRLLCLLSCRSKKVRPCWQALAEG